MQQTKADDWLAATITPVVSCLPALALQFAAWMRASPMMVQDRALLLVGAWQENQVMRVLPVDPATQYTTYHQAIAHL